METLSKVFEDKYNKNVKDCTNEEIYHGLLSWTKEQLKGRGYQEGKKKIYYISAEFLIGKLLSNNLINLGVYDEVAKYLKENGKELSMIEEIEPEPSLGNGGLASWIPSQLWDFREKESGLIITSDFSNRSLRIIFSLRHRIRGSSRRAGLQMQAFPITCRLRALC